MRRIVLWTMLFLFFSASRAAAADPTPEPPPLLPPPLPPTIVNPQWGRIDRYAVWQNYAVDRFGKWRPRVLYTPEGAFYYYDGRPFPWVTVHPLEFMPYAGD